MSIRTILPITSTLALLAVSTAASALKVDSDHSRVSLISTKVLADGASSVTELFTFDSLAGSVDENGMATITIDLGSVETGIEIRNERMGELLFETDTYPEATVTAQLDDAGFNAGSCMLELDLTLDLHGEQSTYTVPALVSADEQSVMVVSQQPVLLDASDYELQGGIGKLAELAGLLHIPTTVPVSFSLTFER